MLTNAAVKAARPRVAAYKVADERGMHLYVAAAPSLRKSFRWRFRWQGKEQLLTIGTWPELSLLDARERCEAARQALARGEDPREARVCKIAQTDNFAEVGRRWHAQMRARWSETHAGDVLRSLERDVFPGIGAMPIAAITPPVVLNALRSVEERGRVETARRIAQRISSVFVFAIAEGLVETNPAAIISKALQPAPPKRHHPALLKIEDARALLDAAELVDAAPVIKLASRFLALTGVRLEALRGAAWAEIDNSSGQPVWRVPAARMKLRVAKKADGKNDHVVPLSRQAMQVLRAAGALGDGKGLIFPSAIGAAIGEAAIGDLYKRTPFAGRHVPHGWRASFSTIMNETGEFDAGVIDQALAHAKKDKVEAAYNRGEQLFRRRELFQAWADLLVGD